MITFLVRCVVSRTFTTGTRYIASHSSLGKASDLIPSEPVWKHIDESELPPPIKVPISMAKYLEQLSLVNFEDKNAVKRLESAIRFADQILLVNTDDVKPLVSLLEDVELPLRNDEVEETDQSNVKLAKEVFEDYYVAPIGNITYTGEDIPDVQEDEAQNHCGNKVD